MRISIVVGVVLLVLSGLIMLVANSVRPFGVSIINRSSILPLEGYNYITDSTLLVLVNSDEVYIPKGFVTDLASMPRWVWHILNPLQPNLIQPSIIHDYLYSCPGDFSRLDVDSIFYYAMINSNVGSITARGLFVAVRLFGGSHFTAGYCNEDDEYA